MIGNIIRSLCDENNYVKPNRVFHSLYKVGKMAVLASKDLTTAKKKLPPMELDLMQEIITGLGVHVS